ncbi:MAG TPA: flagellar hook-basal body complex protein [Polyangiaceae bacterium]|nr:flagellar hook-basal body complex protein [Polyangiaceae bacterium]
MDQRDNGRGRRERRWHGCSVLCLFAAACGGDLTSDERWNDDAESIEPETNTSALEPPPSADADCEVPAIAGYEYADPPSFWLGSQSEQPIAVEGLGFFVSDDAATGRRGVRFSEQVMLSVGPDGSLEDHGGHTLLGHPPSSTSGDGCVVPLRAPLIAAPEATRSIAITMNVDAREPVLTFDIWDPDGTSNGSTSITVIDSLGTQRTLDIHFNNLGGNLFSYNVVADGSELAGGTPGTRTLVSSGTLQFTSDGALQTATTPPLAISFAGGATPNQAVEVDFGEDITTDGTSGLSGTTQFASFTAVYAQWQDGHAMGTGRDVRVAPSGEVTVEFDSGASLAIGKLALARFPNEDRLERRDDGTWRATPASGAPAFGFPASPGRGVLSVPLP